MSCTSLIWYFESLRLEQIVGIHQAPSNGLPPEKLNLVSVEYRIYKQIPSNTQLRRQQYPMIRLLLPTRAKALRENGPSSQRDYDVNLFRLLEVIQPIMRSAVGPTSRHLVQRPKRRQTVLLTGEPTFRREGRRRRRLLSHCV